MKLLNKSLAGFFIMLMSVMSAQAMAQPYVDGVDYLTVQGIPEAKMPVVREFFSYYCPHCYEQEQNIEQLVSLLPKSVTFTRTPVGAGRPSWILGQQAYYLTQKFNLPKSINMAIFSQIHDKGEPFMNSQDLVYFFTDHGVKKSAVEQALKSTDMKFALSNYDVETQLSGITGVPTLLVNGKYVIQVGYKTPAETAKLIDYLMTLKTK